MHGAYFNLEIDWPTFSAMNSGLSRSAGGFKPEARKKLLKTEAFDAGRIKRYALYPLDNRWCYYDPRPPLWNRPRPELVSQRPGDESLSCAGSRSAPARASRPFSPQRCPIIISCGPMPSRFHCDLPRFQQTYQATTTVRLPYTGHSVIHVPRQISRQRPVSISQR